MFYQLFLLSTHLLAQVMITVSILFLHILPILSRLSILWHHASSFCLSLFTYLYMTYIFSPSSYILRAEHFLRIPNVEVLSLGWIHFWLDYLGSAPFLRMYLMRWTAFILLSVQRYPFPHRQEFKFSTILLIFLSLGKIASFRITLWFLFPVSLVFSQKLVQVRLEYHSLHFKFGDTGRNSQIFVNFKNRKVRNRTDVTAVSQPSVCLLDQLFLKFIALFCVITPTNFLKFS